MILPPSLLMTIYDRFWYSNTVIINWLKNYIIFFHFLPRVHNKWYKISTKLEMYMITYNRTTAVIISFDLQILPCKSISMSSENVYLFFFKWYPQEFQGKDCLKSLYIKKKKKSVKLLAV